MLLNDFHLTPVHAYRARIVERIEEKRRYAPPFHTLCYCKCGSGVYFGENETRYEIHQGDIFYYHPNVVRFYYPTSKTPWIISYVNFDGKSIRKGLLKYLGIDNGDPVIHIDSQYRGMIDMLFYGMAVEYAEDTDACNVIMHTILYKLLCQLSVIINSYDQKHVTSSFDFSSVLIYINNHLNHDLSVREICDKTGWSYSRLYSEFKNKMGITPNEFITTSKLDKAADLIIGDYHLSLKEIAMQIGVSSAGYLIKLFKKQFGITPGEFREGLVPVNIVRRNNKTILPIYIVSVTNNCIDGESQNRVDYRNCYQLIYCVEGKMIFTDHEGNMHNVTPGGICFINKSSEYSYQLFDSNCRIISIGFDGEDLSSFIRYLGFDKTNVLKSNGTISLDYLFIMKRPFDIESSFIDIYNNAWKNGYNDVLTNSAKLYELLVFIAILSENDENSVTTEEKKLIPAIEYIREYYASNITNQNIAEAANISEMQLLRLFKTVFGKTPKEYLTAYRLERAKRLIIVHPNKPIKHIAKETGFSDAKSLESAFKEAEGLLPQDFRNINV